jgi:hypothetical protein
MGSELRLKNIMKKISYENFLKTSIIALCIIVIMVVSAMAGTDGQEPSCAYGELPTH